MFFRLLAAISDHHRRNALKSVSLRIASFRRNLCGSRNIIVIIFSHPKGNFDLTLGEGQKIECFLRKKRNHQSNVDLDERNFNETFITSTNPEQTETNA